MKLTTIWSLPLMKFSVRMTYTCDALAQSIAAHLPLRIRYWATMQGMGMATKNYPGHTMNATIGYVIMNMPAPKDKVISTNREE